MSGRFVLLIVIVFFVSCQTFNDVAHETDSTLVKVDIGLGFCGDVDVKSVLPEVTIETKITDVTLASYGPDGRIVNVLHHSDPGRGVAVYMNKACPNNIYALVNMGDMTKAFPDSESDVAKMSYIVPSYDDVAVRGIPMCAALKSCQYEKGKMIQLPLERLFAKLNVRLLHSSLDGKSESEIYAYNLCNKSIYLRQANRVLRPFAPEGSVAENLSDILDVSDYNPDLRDNSAYEGSLNESDFGPGVGYVLDTTITLYVPENIQGVLLPGNTDPFAKVEGRISDIDGKSFAELCTYVEFNANKPNRGDGYGGDITYKCYLGEDNVSDFSIRRNAKYDLVLDFTDEGFYLNSWKVVRGENWSDVRTLCFMDEPYYLYPGTTLNIPVHYHKMSTSLSVDSYGPASDLAWSFVTMPGNGILCLFQGDNKMVGSNGCSDLYFRAVATSIAKPGGSFQIKVSTKDGVKSDYATVYIPEIGDLNARWDFIPQYVSQTGRLCIDGAVSALMPLSASVSDPSVLRCTSDGNGGFAITALRPGKSEISITNANGSQNIKMELEIDAPYLRVSDELIELAPDGKTANLNYYYADKNGQQLTNIDEDVFNQYLKPVATCADYISAVLDNASVTLYINKLYSYGLLLNVGSSYNVSLSATDCPDVSTCVLKAKVKDPFAEINAAYTGRLDDYSLFRLTGVHSTIKQYFAEEISTFENLRFEIPPVSADALYVSSSFEPSWKGEFSNDNEVYVSNYNASDNKSIYGASVSVSQNSISTSTKHSAGKHELKLNVRNRHSGEYLSKTVAEVDVYVHTVVGASAEFGYFACNTTAGSRTIAGIYNTVAKRNIFSTSSSNNLCYMDVSMVYMTDVSKVYMLDLIMKKASNNQNFMSSLDVLTPSVVDGEVNNTTKIMYSLCTSGDERVGYCGETPGARRGIGTVLYRALKQSSTSLVPTITEMYSMLLGFDSLSGTASAAYAPSYYLHDVAKSSDMTQNRVNKNLPFYFAPAGYSQYLDSSGKGYHVIHTLESIAPKTCGWINLL